MYLNLVPFYRGEVQLAAAHESVGMMAEVRVSGQSPGNRDEGQGLQGTILHIHRLALLLIVGSP